MSMLKMAATMVVIGIVAAFTSREPAAAAPTAGAAKSTLTVTIVGSSQVQRNATCEYTAVVSGGTPPYTFSWIGVNGDPWAQTTTASWSSIGNKAIWVDVADALSDSGSDGHGVLVVSTGGSC